MQKVVVIGGGYAGTAFAVHLSRTAKSPVDIVVLEPRNEIGGGVAYSTVDPDHRLNAPDVIHPIYPHDPLHFRRWLEATGRLVRDPDAWYSDDRLYPRRGDFGAYLSAQFAVHARGNPSGSSIVHLRTPATSIERQGGRFRISVSDGETVDAHRCVLAIGPDHTPCPLPGSTLEQLGRHFVPNPFRAGALDAIRPEDRVLMLGAGLTSADVVASLIGHGHTGPIGCLSRHGFRPQDQNPEASTEPLWDRLAVQPPVFVQKHGIPSSIRELTRIVREDARARMARGEPWHGAIDEVRDAAGEIWRALEPVEKRRFIRHVKPLYDSHRFRIPPQTRDILAAAERRGQLTFQAGRVVEAARAGDRIHVMVRPRRAGRTQPQEWDVIVSCLGFSCPIDESSNPIIQCCFRNGLVRPSDMGRGFDADARCRAIAPDGRPDSQLYVLGAMTLDRFGETPAAIFLLRQVLRMLPPFVSSLRE